MTQNNNITEIIILMGIVCCDTDSPTLASSTTWSLRSPRVKDEKTTALHTLIKDSFTESPSSTFLILIDLSRVPLSSLSCYLSSEKRSLTRMKSRHGSSGTVGNTVLSSGSWMQTQRTPQELSVPSKKLLTTPSPFTGILLKDLQR